jgi:hypothetical protein
MAQAVRPDTERDVQQIEVLDRREPGDTISRSSQAAPELREGGAADAAGASTLDVGEGGGCAR